MTGVDWNPAQYERFAVQRAQPFWDLVEMIHPGGIERAVDLGCGTGSLTVHAAERLGIGRMTGIDNSPAMLDVAASRGRVEVDFEYGDISRWTSGGDHDLVLANAALQWVPDHRAVIERWASQLTACGQLAIQVPANADHPSHTCSATVAEREPFRSAMGGTPPADPVGANVLAPEAYAELLHDLGFEDPDVRLVVYPQVMPSSATVVDWTRGTSLTRFFTALPDDLHERFVDAYRSELLVAIGDRAPYFYAFKRILMNARRRAA